jgi:predicted transcriptional regulator
MTDTAIEKVLKQLLEGKFSSQELSEKLNMPLVTVRCTVSQLRHMGLVEDVPLEKRGKPFTLTQEGHEYIKKKMSNNAPVS